MARADLDSRQFLLRLADIMVSLRGVEGRKSIVLFSEGFESDNVAREMETVAAAAAQAYAVVYALDLNSRSVGVDEMNARGGEQFVEIASRLEPLGSLAAESDGVLFNDAAPQVERIFDQIVGTSQDYYLVGFAPSPAALADRGRYSRIRVSVKRPGARVSTRTGYALGEASNPASRRTAVEAALAAPFSQQGLAGRIHHVCAQGDRGRFAACHPEPGRAAAGQGRRRTRRRMCCSPSAACRPAASQRAAAARWTCRPNRARVRRRESATTGRRCSCRPGST